MEFKLAELFVELTARDGLNESLMKAQQNAELTTLDLEKLDLASRKFPIELANGIDLSSRAAKGLTHQLGFAVGNMVGLIDPRIGAGINSFVMSINMMQSATRLTSKVLDGASISTATLGATSTATGTAIQGAGVKAAAGWIGLLGPIALVVAGVGAVVFIVKSLIDWGEKSGETLKKAMEEAREAIEGVKASVMELAIKMSELRGETGTVQLTKVFTEADRQLEEISKKRKEVLAAPVGVEEDPWSRKTWVYSKEQQELLKQLKAEEVAINEWVAAEIGSINNEVTREAADAAAEQLDAEEWMNERRVISEQATSEEMMKSAQDLEDEQERLVLEREAAESTAGDRMMENEEKRAKGINKLRKKEEEEELDFAAGIEERWRKANKTEEGRFSSITEISRQLSSLGVKGKERDPTTDELVKFASQEQKEHDRADVRHKELVGALKAHGVFIP